MVLSSSIDEDLRKERISLAIDSPPEPAACMVIAELIDAGEKMTLESLVAEDKTCMERFTATSFWFLIASLRSIV